MLRPTERLPAPWSVVDHEESFEVRAANGEAIVYVYFDDPPRASRIRPRHSREMARRLAVNIARLPELLAARPERKDAP